MPTTPSWFQAEGTPPTFPRLSGNLTADVAVIGGGIAGLSAAYELAKAGKRTVLLEQERIGNGDTGNTTAFITQVTDESLVSLRKTFGDERAARVWRSGKETIAAIERLILEERIPCHFVHREAVMFATDDAGRKRLAEEDESARALGFSTTLRNDPLPFRHNGWMHIEEQAVFHPILFLRGLARCVDEIGVMVFEKTHVHDVEGDGPVKLYTQHGVVTANDVVIATHGPVTQPRQFSMRTEAKRTYVIDAQLPRGLIQDGIYWDNEDPYHYFRIDRDERWDRIILGGEDHITGQSDVPEEEHFDRLKKYLTHLFPDVVLNVLNQWSGQVYETADGLPYIGKPIGQEHYYVATGFAGNGMTFGMMSGAIIRGLIVDGAHSWADLYSPARMHGVGEMMRMGISMTRGWLSGMAPDVESVASIAPGTGAVMMEEGKPVAVFKAIDGRILKVSAICTHLRCTVKWNGAEESWDCPCHGSRFTPEGDVLNGPAIAPLERLDNHPEWRAE